MIHGVILHSISKEKLSNLFEKKIIDKSETSLYLHSFGYFPWENNVVKNEITTFSKYYAFLTNKNPVESVIELIYKAKENIITIVDENDTDILLTISKIDLLKLNLDSKYKSIKWFIKDLKFQVDKDTTIERDDSEDCERFYEKTKSKFFNERIIYVDGGMGDHVMALPLLEKLSSKVYICCKYPFIFEHIPNLGFIDWNDGLFGGYKRFVYEYGSSNESKTIIDAFFEMYGEYRNDSDLMIYNGKKLCNLEIPKGKNLALICTSAAKIQNQDSNKDWSDIRWFKLVNELKKKNYYVIQVGSKGDNQIPNVDYKFLDKPISELAGIIEESSLWITVDTFFHHFASSIKPNVGVCLTPFYNDHAKHVGVKYIEKDCGKNFYDRKWWLDIQQPERKECMNLIRVEDVLYEIENITKDIKLDNICVLYEIEDFNQHLLEFSTQFLKGHKLPIYVNTKNSSKSQNTIDILNTLVDKNLITEYLDVFDEFEFIQKKGFKFFLKFNADEFLEYNDIVKGINFIKEIRTNSLKIRIKKFFKNLNLFLDSKNDFQKKVFFRTDRSEESDEVFFDGFCLNNLEQTYLENKTEYELEVHKNYYYFNINKIEINGKKYDILKNNHLNFDNSYLKKVLIICQNTKNNGSNWRAFQLYDNFRNSINYNIDFSLDFDINKLVGIDLLIIIRPILSCKNYLSIAKSMGVKVAIDYDDPFPLEPKNYPNFIEMINETHSLIRDYCDFLITTTEPLKHYFSQLTERPVEIFPNVVQPNLYTKKNFISYDKIILGWYGNGGHLPSLLKMKDQVYRILEEFPNVYFYIYTDNENFSTIFEHSKVSVKKYEYNFLNFEKILNDVDINLSPASEHYIYLCKSDIRPQMMAIKGIPSIVSNFAEYKKFANKNKGAIIAEDDEWYDKIKFLIENPTELEKLSDNASETIQKYYDYNFWCEYRNKIIFEKLK